MTAYRPLVSDNNIRIKECTSSEYDLMLQQIAYLYSQNPTVELSVVASGGNISPTMTDTRYRSGTAARNTSGPWPAVTTFPSEATTGEPDVVTTTYDKMSQTVTSATKPTYSIKPVRVDTNGVTEMTETDVIDTFIDPVVDAMVGLTGTNVLGAGAYYISTSSSISGSTSLGTVYTDTAANLAGYLASNIGTTGTQQDVFTSINYQLFQVDGVTSVGGGWRGPLIIDYVANNRNNPTGLRHMTQVEFDNYFGPLIRHAIYGYTGMTLRYNVDGSGTTQGSAMTNTVLTGVTGNYTTYKATADDYRAQEFPNGTLVTADTYELKLERT
jgi:hypothetical protein